MGYDLHITRRLWWHDEGGDISKSEFIAYVSADAEFTYPGLGGEDWADWRSPTTDYTSWLCWSDGRIHTKNPNPEFIDKVVSIAAKLGAKAQGDDGEVYRSSKEADPPPTIDATDSSGPDPEKIPNWTSRVFIVLFVLVLAAFFFWPN